MTTKRASLVERLRAYDSKNHRGKYALLCREAADALEFGCEVKRKKCGCAVSLDKLSTFLCEKHSNG